MNDTDRLNEALKTIIIVCKRETDLKSKNAIIIEALIKISTWRISREFSKEDAATMRDIAKIAIKEVSDGK